MLAEPACAEKAAERFSRPAWRSSAPARCDARASSPGLARPGSLRGRPVRRRGLARRRPATPVTPSPPTALSGRPRRERPRLLATCSRPGSPASPRGGCIPFTRSYALPAVPPSGPAGRAVAGAEQRAADLPGPVPAGVREAYDDDLLEHLRGTRHPDLPPAEVHWSQAVALVLVTPTYDRTLASGSSNAGRRGPPACHATSCWVTWAEVAGVLDDLDQQRGLWHLAINPSSILLEGERAWLADFGLVSLVWLPTGQPVGPLNPRSPPPSCTNGPPARRRTSTAWR